MAMRVDDSGHHRGSGCIEDARSLVQAEVRSAPDVDDGRALDDDDRLLQRIPARPVDQRGTGQCEPSDHGLTSSVISFVPRWTACRSSSLRPSRTGTSSDRVPTGLGRRVVLRTGLLQGKTPRSRPLVTNLAGNFYLPQGGLRGGRPDQAVGRGAESPGTSRSVNGSHHGPSYSNATTEVTSGRP